MTPPLSEVIYLFYLHTFITILNNNTINIYILSTKIISYNIIIVLSIKRKTPTFVYGFFGWAFRDAIAKRLPIVFFTLAALSEFESQKNLTNAKKMQYILA